jgi:argininosuccinate lyase
MPLWSGRLPGKMDPQAALLNNSLPFDKRLAQVDVQGSIAWARALAKAGIFSTNELEIVTNGLKEILNEFNQQKFIFLESDEDIHTAVERRLIELIGLPGGKLHTGRSRNDQVATDLKLWLLDNFDLLEKSLTVLRTVLVDRTERDFGIPFPGYTHFQQAQPILLSHWWLSHFWVLQRDHERLKDIRSHTRSTCPLGSGALAGTTFSIDRNSLAIDLGFEYACQNSLDGVSDRDFVVEFLFWASLLAVHLSRLAEALILYSTVEFGFVTLADEFSTGSSLMPQKKNPDPLELIRGKSNFIISRLNGMLSLLKGLPSAYDKDLQEDKPAVFEVTDTMGLLLPVMAGVIESLTINKDRCLNAMSSQMMSTDLADYLVKKGIPFRDAHGAVGRVVRKANELGYDLSDLPMEEWQAINSAFQQDIHAVFDVYNSVGMHSAWGGTSPARVKEQLELARKLID